MQSISSVLLIVALYLERLCGLCFVYIYKVGLGPAHVALPNSKVLMSISARNTCNCSHCKLLCISTECIDVIPGTQGTHRHSDVCSKAEQAICTVVNKGLSLSIVFASIQAVK